MPIVRCYQIELFFCGRSIAIDLDVCLWKQIGYSLVECFVPILSNGMIEQRLWVHTNGLHNGRQEQAIATSGIC